MGKTGQSATSASASVDYFQKSSRPPGFFPVNPIVQRSALKDAGGQPVGDGNSSRLFFAHLLLLKRAEEKRCTG